MTSTIILCGGRGARLRPLTDALPKALVPLNGKPILQHIIESYIRHGRRTFVLCLGYYGDKVIEFCRQAGFDADIQFSNAGEAAGMLERLVAARPYIGDRAIVTYGDTLIDVDIDDLEARHRRSGAALTITTADVRSPFGQVQTEAGGRVVDFREKPVHTYYVGQMVVEAGALEGVAPDVVALPDGLGLVHWLRTLIAEGRVWQYAYSGPQITFNTEQDLAQAERDLMSFYTLREREEQ